MPFLISLLFGQALFGISIQCKRIHDLCIKWNLRGELEVAVEGLLEKEGIAHLW